MNLIETTTSTANYASSQNIESDCIDIQFFNKGTNDARIDGLPLTPGQQLIYSCNQGEILKTIFQLVFIPGVGTNSVYVVRRYYKNL